MDYLYIKALHIVFVVTWFAGLFYIVRLFIYDTEADTRTEPERSILQKQFRLMQRRLWFGITWPSMILALTFGTWMVYIVPDLLQQTYFLIKLGFVAGLIIYHFQCHVFFQQLQQGQVRSTGNKLRIFNEVATLFLVAIVFLIVLKSSTTFLYGLAGLVALAAVLMLAIRIYRKKRKE